MRRHLGRRAVLAGGASALATGLWAAPLDSTIRPRARAGSALLTPMARRSSADIIASSRVSGQVGFVIADATSGQVLDAVLPDAALPPASVMKAITALYALETLGPAYRFETKVLGTAPVVDGVLDGDLILVGGGDPTLATDDLAALADAVAATGLQQVRGRFLVWGGALPGVEEIDETQLDHVGYNPAISGLNLNFNRVHFEWKREDGDFAISMDARSEAYRPPVQVARMALVDRPGPVYAYRREGGREMWSVARGALNDFGSRWLPVRQPAIYAGEVFQVLAGASGLALRPPERAVGRPSGHLIARVESGPMSSVLQDMLKYSTNLTAEVSGMMATKVASGQGRGLRTSALSMARWAEDRAGVSAAFVDHSGLGDASRISADQMVRLLASPGAMDRVRPLMKPVRMVDEDRRAIPDFPGEVRAKTGTLNFVNSLAGYARTSGGRDLAFAIFAADLNARAAGIASGEERPRGSRTFAARSRNLQQRLLQRWILAGDQS